MKKRQLAILISSAVVLLLLVAMVGVGRPIPKTEIGYTTFLEQVKAGEVEEVTITDGDTVNFTKKDDSAAYVTTNPRTFTFKEELQIGRAHV